MKLDKDLKDLGTSDYFPKDILIDDLLYGVTIRSSISKGKIKSVSLPVLPADYAVVRAEDIPGENNLALFNDNMPILAATDVTYLGQPLLLLAGPDKATLRKLAKEIKIQYEEEMAVAYPGQSEPAHTLDFNKGNCSEVLADASGNFIFVSGEYKTGFQNTYHLLAQSVFAYFEPKKNVVIFSTSEYPFHVRQTVASLLDLPASRVRVVVPHQGSCTGDNLVYPSLLAGHAALLTYITKRPVRMLFELEEELFCTPCKYPCLFKIRSALDKNGQLTALDVEIIYDSGAYLLATPFILERMALAVCGPYHCEHVRINARAYRTNHTPAFSFSALGEDLAFFATELHTSKLAAAMDESPYRWRIQNLVKGGSNLVLGQKIPKGENINLVLEDVIRRSDFDRKYSAYEANRKGRMDYLSSVKPLWGVGLALTFHGVGAPGAWEEAFPSQIKIVLEPGKTLRLYSSFVNSWQEQLFKSLAKKILKSDVDDIILEMVDTSVVPDTGPSLGSRVQAVLLHLFEQSCLSLQKKKEQESLPIEIKHKQLTNKHQVWSWENLAGNFYSALCWEATVVEVIVDPISFRPHCKRIWTTIEAGKIANRERLVTEVEGAVLRNLEMALLSRTAKVSNEWDNHSYHLSGLNSMDKPELSINFLETEQYRKTAVFKGTGEQAVLGVAPAFTAAVSQALGIPITTLPVTETRLDQLVTAEIAKNEG